MRTQSHQFIFHNLLWRLFLLSHIRALQFNILIWYSYMLLCMRSSRPRGIWRTVCRKPYVAEICTSSPELLAGIPITNNNIDAPLYFNQMKCIYLLKVKPNTLVWSFGLEPVAVEAASTVARTSQKRRTRIEGAEWRRQWPRMHSRTRVCHQIKWQSVGACFV